MHIVNFVMNWLAITLIREKRGAREGAGGEKTGDKGERRDNVRGMREGEQERKRREADRLRSEMRRGSREEGMG